MVRRWVVPLSATALISACLNDYDQFEAAGSVMDPQVGGGAMLGGAPATPGAGGSDEPAAAGANGGGGLAGAPGAGEGGSAGTPLACEAPSVACDEACVDTSSDEEHCGGCGNSCTNQSAGFECLDGQCGCTSLEQCGSDNAQRGCEAGRCSCDGEMCAPGEVCGRINNQFACECNDNQTCDAGETCCESPQGCFNLELDPANCGACARACAPGQSCVLGQCG
jgi:hypothetical protein